MGLNSLRARCKTLVLSIGLLVLSSQAPLAQASAPIFYENSSGTPLLKLIKTAKKSIDIEIYTLKDSGVQTAILSALSKGVKVRIIQEDAPAATKCKPFAPLSSADDAKCSDIKHFIKDVKAAGGKYIPFNKALCGTEGSRCFQHGKLTLVDRSVALVSTGNYDASNLCDVAANTDTCNRDYSVLVSDEQIVSTLYAIFEKDFSSKPYDLKEILAAAQLQDQLTVSPYSMKPVIGFIDSAKKSIMLQTQYLHDPTMNEALLRAAKRGVKIYLTIASACSFARPDDSDIAKWTKIFSEFDKAGVQTRIFTRNVLVNGVSGYLHSKAILVDGTAAWIGSVNGSTTSLTNNREFGIFSKDATLTSKLKSFLVADFNNNQTESWQDSLECKNDPLPKQ